MVCPLRPPLSHLVNRGYALACRLNCTSDGQGRPVVIGFHRTPSGVGESARLCLAALAVCGYAPMAQDLSFRHLPHDLLPPLAGPQDLKNDGGPFIMHVNPPELPSVIRHFGWRLLQHRLVIGYWAWELPCLPPSWRFALRLVDEVWVPSRFCAEAVRPHSAKPVRIVPHPLPPFAGRPDRAGFGLPDTGFTALTVADLRSSLARKNPLGTVAAFRRAFGDSNTHHLILKIGGIDGNTAVFDSLREAIAGFGNVLLLTNLLPPGRMADLIASVDCVVSLHRAEGFGLVIAQGMQAGKPVVATDWSGSRDFVDASCAMPVPATLIPVDDPQRRYCPATGQFWADPDLDAAAYALRTLANNPGLSARLGEAARRRITTLCSPAAYAARLGPAFAAAAGKPS